eukprot:COSAG02_NODE_1837_length_10712_cov_4.781306_11_plen_146_part_01
MKPTDKCNRLQARPEPLFFSHTSIDIQMFLAPPVVDPDPACDSSDPSSLYTGGSCSIREAFCGQRRRAWLSAFGRCVPGMLRLACTGAARRVQQRGSWRAAALPGRVWRGNGAVAMPPALRRSGSASGMQGLRRQLLSTSAADDAE